MVFNFALMDKNGFFSTAMDDSLNERLICDLLACVSAIERNLCSRNEFEYFCKSVDTFNVVPVENPRSYEGNAKSIAN
jgi:hypothetical protein